MAPDASPTNLVEGLATVTRVLSGVVRAAPPGARATIWRFPQIELGGPADFAARGGLELVLHAHDVATGLGVPFGPASARTRPAPRAHPGLAALEHPGWTAAPHTR